MVMMMMMMVMVIPSYGLGITLENF